jgi:integrase
MKVAAVSFADIEKLHRDISRRAPAHANRVIACAKVMFKFAVRWGMRLDNPVRGIEMNPEGKRTRFASPDELPRLMAALTGHGDQQAANIIRLLLLSGARRSEVFLMRWSDIDLTTGTWRKPGATVKTRTDHVVPLSGPARLLLAGIERTASEFVFPGRLGGHRKKIDHAWASICQAAEIVGLRVHDLRHTHATYLASTGHSLPLIGALLGHTTAQTTLRYAHLMQEPQRQATETVGAILSGQQAAEVIPLRKK